MPSLSPELHCAAECPLERYEMPLDNESSVQMSRESGLAVAVAVGLEGQQSSDPRLQHLAQECAARIVRGDCPMWALHSVKGGLISK